MVFSESRDYYIPKGLTLTRASNNYFTTGDTYVSALELTGDSVNGYSVDIYVVSEDVGNTYNLVMYDALTAAGSLSSYIRKVYCIEDSTDGGVTETNQDFYNRTSKSMSLKNLTTYRGIQATLYENFNVSDVVPIGLRDNEMRRDLIELNNIGIVHRGGMADIYVKMAQYTIATGYQKPLGFPYEYNNYSVTDSPSALLASWNMLSFPNVDIYTRGSYLEDIQNLSVATNMKTLTSSIQAIHEYCSDNIHEAIHSDNLVKQMWPLVVRVGLTVSSSSDSTTAISLTKTAVTNYINGLLAGAAPKVSVLIKSVITAGVSQVQLPITMDCYYLTENLTMQTFGLNLSRIPSTSILRPVEADGLKFVIDDDTQISIRNCCWYCNEDLVSVEVI